MWVINDIGCKKKLWRAIIPPTMAHLFEIAHNKASKSLMTLILSLSISPCSSLALYCSVARLPSSWSFGKPRSFSQDDSTGAERQNEKKRIERNITTLFSSKGHDGWLEALFFQRNGRNATVNKNLFVHIYLVGPIFLAFPPSFFVNLSLRLPNQPKLERCARRNRSMDRCCRV